MPTTAPLPRRAATAGLALATAVALLPAVVLTAAPAVAEEVHPRAEKWTIAGHGWGHGRGMSQHGALGAAQAGKGYGDIVSFYYPGTTLTPVDTSEDWIRVLLTANYVKELGSPPISGSLQVAPASGLTARDLATGRTKSLSGADMWQVVRAHGGLVLQSVSGGKWSSHVMPGDNDIVNAGPIQLTATGGVLRRVYPTGQSRDYRGELRAVDAGSGVAAVNHLLMEPYLKAVVPAEMPASWHLEALKAQSVAARSYSSRVRADARRANPSGAWDICDSTQCQVYGGVGSEDARTNGAVDATAGRTLMYGNYPVFAEFSSSNGGWTVAGNHPYQVAKADPYDGLAGGSVHSWKAVLTAADLERRFPALGKLTRMRVVSRDGNGDWGGRVLSVVLEGVKDGRGTSITTTGREVYLSRPWPSVGDGLKSNWWTITGSTSDPVGSLDLVRSGSTGERVAGWALDPDVDTTLRVHVYVDGRATVAVDANRDRPDVGNVYPSHGSDHGFDVTLPLTDGRHTVCAYAINAPGTPGSNRLLGCRDVVAKHVPFGALDHVSQVPGGAGARGWTIDPDTTGPVTVHAYVGGRAVRSAVADQYRPDVGRAYPAYGDHHGYGAVAPLPSTEGPQSVCVYALNVAGTAGGSSRLGCRTLDVRHRPLGRLDGARIASGRLTADGWALDPDTAASVAVHLYVDGKPVSAASASLTRNDIAAAYPGYGPAHGYRVSASVPPGAHRACVYALNAAGTPGSSVLLGCATASG